MELKILDTLDRKAGIKSHRGSFLMQPGQPTFTEHSYDKIAREGYMKNPFVYSAISFGSNAFAGVGLKLEKTIDEDGTVETIKNHPVLDLIRNPNDDITGLMFKKEVYSFFKLSGKSFTHMISPDTGRNAGKPRQMVNWVPSSVDVLKGENELIGGFELKDHEKKYAKEDVIYIKDFHPLNTADGHPAAMSVARAVDVSNAQLDWNLSILQNRGVPAHVFRGGWTLEQAKKWQHKNERETSGQYKAGRDLYLPDTVEVQKLGFNTQELDWLNGLKAMARIIYSSYNMPSELFNDGENKTYSNFEQAIKAILMFDTIPTWKIILSFWNKDLVSKFDKGLQLVVDKDSIEALADDMLEKTKQAIQLYEGNLTNKGESRTIAGLDDDVPDKERTVIRSNLIPDDKTVDDDVTEEELSMNGEEGSKD